jgi:nucleoside-diphosphate-sugar epimerase
VHSLVIGGTRFIGRHLVDQLLAEGDRVTLFTRGEHGNPFAEHDRVDHVTGDRTVPADVSALADHDPDRVFDTCAMHPPEVRHATEVFADCGAYVYVSSGSAYDDDRLPLREDESNLHDCTPEQEGDDGPESYGPRKAECDRAVAAAAEDGVRAMAVRPMLVYGPHDYTERFDYWVERVRRGEPFLVPGDGAQVLHRAYVADVARALRVVAEEGTAGEAYNVADRGALSRRATIRRLGETLDVDPQPVYVSERELATEGIEPTEFPLYQPDAAYVSTGKLAALGWASTPLPEALAATAEDVRDGRTGDAHGPDPEAAATLLDRLAA